MKCYKRRLLANFGSSPGSADNADNYAYQKEPDFTGYFTAAACLLRAGGAVMRSFEKTDWVQPLKRGFKRHRMQAKIDDSSVTLT